MTGEERVGSARGMREEKPSVPDFQEAMGRRRRRGRGAVSARMITW